MKKLYEIYKTIFGEKKMKWYVLPLLIILSIYLLINFIMLFPVIIACLQCLPHYISNIMDATLFKIETKHIAVFSVFIAAILGIAIPISLTVISNLDRKYKQSGISKEFLKEPISKSQFYVLFLNIIFLVIAMFLNSINNFISAVYIVFFLLSVLNFIAYILLIQDYLINAKLHIYNKCEEALTQYLIDE